MALKKVVSLLLTLMITSLVSAGCGKGSNTEPSTTAQPTTNSEQTTTNTNTSATDGTLKVSDKDMTITLWDIATEDPTKKIQEGAVNRFMKDHPNVKVEMNHIVNDTYKQKLVVAMSSGKCPNMYIHWGGGPMIEYINSGFAVPITDLMKNHCKVDFLKAAIAQSTYKDEIYAVPFTRISGSGVFYNKNIFAKYNLQAPKTISELENVCETLKSNGIIPFALANQSKWTGSMYYMYLVARKSGLEEFNKAVDGSGSFESEAFQYAGDTIQKWVKAGYFPEGVNSLSADDGMDRQLMYQEKAAMMLQGTWQAPQMYNDNKDWYTQNIDYFGFPTLEGSSADQSIVVGTAIDNAFSFNTGDDKDLLNACFILATQYYNDDTYIKEQLETGSIPSINGAGDNVSDHCMQKVWADFSKASDVQLWYDQYLPPEVAEVHKTTSQEIFGLTKTPAQANKELQSAMTKYLSKKQ